MANVEFITPLYEPEPNDVWYQPVNAGPTIKTSAPAPVNLSALEYYAFLGMKPLRIGTLIGTTHTTIWNTGPLRASYERGAAKHELWLRAILFETTKVKPQVALDLLNRSNGTPDIDMNNGRAPDEQVEIPTWVMQAPVFKLPTELTKSESAELAGEDD